MNANNKAMIDSAVENRLAELINNTRRVVRGREQFSVNQQMIDEAVADTLARMLDGELLVKAPPARKTTNNVLAQTLAELVSDAELPATRKNRRANSAPAATLDDDDDPALFPMPNVRAGSRPEDVARRGTGKKRDNGRRGKGNAKQAQRATQRATSARSATVRASSAKRAADAAHAPTPEMADLAQDWFDSIDEQYENTPDGEKFQIDLSGHSETFKTLFINALNKGMSALRAHNWAAKKAYPENYIQY